jgi:two-component system LytT family response regulator
MRCIVVDDEPIARKGIEKMLGNIPSLKHIGSFENANLALNFIKQNETDLIFLDIQMPGLNGLDFAKQISKTSLIIFITAFSEFALDSYDVDAVDYLIKPIRPARFEKAVEKARTYHKMLLAEEENILIEQIESDFMFIKSDRRYFKVAFRDILFVEGLKDYVIIHTENQKLITHGNLKNVHTLLPESKFLRVNRSYIINIERIDSFSNNDVFIGTHEIGIGNFYRDEFFEKMLGK